MSGLGSLSKTAAVLQAFGTSLVIVGSFTMMGNSHAMAAADTSPQEILPYATARQTLLERGFHPYVMPGADICDGESPRCSPELVGCKHKRHWICDYTLKVGNTVYQAETNSDVPLVDSFYCLVNCGPANPERSDASSQ